MSEPTRPHLPHPFARPAGVPAEFAEGRVRAAVDSLAIHVPSAETFTVRYSPSGRVRRVVALHDSCGNLLWKRAALGPDPMSFLTRTLRTSRILEVLVPAAEWHEPHRLNRVRLSWFASYHLDAVLDVTAPAQ